VTATGAVWRNWSRGVTVRPRRVERPTSAEAVQRAVIAAASAGLPIKAVGTGHSFSGIALAPGVQLDLHDLQLGSGAAGNAGGTRHGGVIVDIDRRRVTVAAGTPLYRLPGLQRRRHRPADYRGRDRHRNARHRRQLWRSGNLHHGAHPCHR
jgi:FAD/FMN-containing dehydrogenase